MDISNISGPVYWRIRASITSTLEIFTPEDDEYFYSAVEIANNENYRSDQSDSIKLKSLKYASVY